MRLQNRFDVNGVLLVALLIIPLSFSPFISYDPFNTAKFISLSIFGILSLIIILINRGELWGKNYKLTTNLSLAFIIWCICSWVFSGHNLIDGLFGVPSRNYGVLSNIFLQLIFLIAILVSSSKLSHNTILILHITALIVMIYGFLQIINLDPISWSNKTSAINSFFGNQNFLSAYLGIVMTSGFSFLFVSKTKSIYKILILIFISTSSIFLFFTKSTQGYAVFIMGISISILILIYKKESFRKYFKLYLTFFSISGILLAMDLLQKTPWESKLYEDSVSSRGDFWRASINMGFKDPIFGVGLGGFVDNYRSSRDLISLSRGGIDFTVDSPHNIFLEFFSSGGLPLVFIYTLIVILVIKRCIQYIRISEKFDPIHTGIVSAWVAFMGQAFISLNEIGLSTIGWILSGLLLGYKPQDELNALSSKLGTKKLSITAVTTGTVAGLLLALPQLLVDAKFRHGIEEASSETLVAIADDWPMNSSRMSLIGQVLRTNGFPEEARLVLSKAVLFNPNHFEAWYELSQCPGISIDEKLRANLNVRRLDPLRDFQD